MLPSATKITYVCSTGPCSAVIVILPSNMGAAGSFWSELGPQELNLRLKQKGSGKRKLTLYCKAEEFPRAPALFAKPKATRTSASGKKNQLHQARLTKP